MDKKVIQLLGETLVSSPLFKIMIVDADLNLVWCNKAHADMFPGEELIGKKCYKT